MAALYEQHDGYVVASEYCRGPWSPDAQHGGATAALLMRAFEQADPGPERAIARVTYELVRPVPLGQLKVETDVARPGKRVQLLEGRISAPDGTEVVRARAVSVARSGVDAGVREAPPEGPEVGEPTDFGLWGEDTIYPRDGMEIRFVAGEFMAPGPSTAWFRLRVPVIAGEQPSGLQRLAAAADFPNGIATELPWGEYVFINPDLTVHVEREPAGEWIGLDARMRVAASGVGQSEAVLYDQQGRVGRSLQSLYIAAR